MYVVSEMALNEYIDDTHGYFLKARLEDLRMKGDFCDVTFIVEEKMFPVHKCVMAASSDYFATMFAGSFKEEKLDVIPLEGVTASAFGEIVTYIYTGKISFDNVPIIELFEAAQLFLFDNVKSASIEFILKNLKVKTCLEYLLLAERHSLPKVKSECEEFTHEHFDEIAQDKMIKELPFKTFCHIIASDKLRCKSELSVLEAICNWLPGQVQQCTDEQKTELLAEFRFGLVGEDFSRVFQKEYILGAENCKKMQIKMLDFLLNIKKQPLKSDKFNKPRGNACLVVIGGSTEKVWDPDSVIGSLDIITLHDNGKVLLKAKAPKKIDLPTPRSDCATVSVGNFLFVLGGRSKNGVEGTVHRYDPVNNYWFQLRSMGIKRYSHAAAVLGASILVIGGLDGEDQESGSVEMYDIGEDKWQHKSDFPEKKEGLAACTMDGQVYVCTGTNETENKLYAYDPKGDIWLVKTKFDHACHHMCLIQSDQTIFFIGGQRCNKNGQLAQVHIGLTSFANDTMQVCAKQSMAWCTSRMGVACIPGKCILVVGGIGCKAIKDKKEGYIFMPHDTIQVYDIESQEWSVSDTTLSHKMANCQAEILIFPQEE